MNGIGYWSTIRLAPGAVFVGLALGSMAMIGCGGSSSNQDNSGSGETNSSGTASGGVGGATPGAMGGAAGSTSGSTPVAGQSASGPGGLFSGLGAKLGKGGGASSASSGSGLLGSTAAGAGGVAVATEPAKELADGTVGSSCGTCGSGLTCVPGTPNGYCTRQCSSNTECGAQGACVAGADLQVCYRLCKSNADCRSGYACVTAGTVSVCDVAVSTTGSGGAPSTADGTCQGVCEHYLGCKGIYDTQSVQACLLSCAQLGLTPQYMTAYQAADCTTAVQIAEGTGTSSGASSGSSSSCSGCVWDGSSCIWLSQSNWGAGPYSGAASSCDASCCPEH